MNLGLGLGLLLSLSLFLVGLGQALSLGFAQNWMIEAVFDLPEIGRSSAAFIAQRILRLA